MGVYESLMRPGAAGHRRRLLFGLVALSLASGGAVATRAASALPTATPACAVNRPATWPAGERGRVYLCSYSEAGLTRTSYVYVPQGWTGRSAVPVVVALHGCTQQGPDMAYLSRFDSQADRNGAIIVYPNQAAFKMTGTTSFDGNGSSCWNWFLPQGQQRGAGEPALIAGLTRQAVRLWRGDPARTYVIGISAGGAMADIMAVTYPDLYAATGILAGCEYTALPCLGSAGALPPSVSAQRAYQAAPGRQRVVPFIVENGDADNVVPLPNAVEVTQQWQIADDAAAHHGTPASQAPSLPCARSNYVPATPVHTGIPPIVENPYEILYYSLDGSACAKAPSSPAAALGELWIVNGEMHAWPGGPLLTTSDIYTNPGGPDFTEAAYRFFMAHPCRVARGACAPA